jgi:hypothetical protein
MPAKQLKLKPEERRRARRTELRHKPKGKLYFCTKLQNINVLKIRDISPFGLCLLLEQCVDSIGSVRLKYVHNGIQIEVSGAIAWRNPVTTSGPRSFGTYGCWVGIFLQPHDIDANFALYQALMEGAMSEPFS